jgi:D-alanyl-D-alanine dipeptidase
MSLSAHPKAELEQIDSRNSLSIASEKPSDFVSVVDIDPTIRTSPRYVGEDNFVGRPIDGYRTQQIFLTHVAACSLKNVQKAVRLFGLAIVLYDGYRPQRAVDAFKAWSLDPSDQIAKNLYYPTIKKEQLFELGYISERSGHSRGSTVDVSLIASDCSIRPLHQSSRILNNGHLIPFLEDGTLDMGSSFDLFHEASHHDTSLVGADALANRSLLRQIMETHGWRGISTEWWHYTYIQEPYPQTYFDFIA